MDFPDSRRNGLFPGWQLWKRVPYHDSAFGRSNVCHRAAQTGRCFLRTDFRNFRRRFCSGSHLFRWRKEYHWRYVKWWSWEWIPVWNHRSGWKCGTDLLGILCTVCTGTVYRDCHPERKNAESGISFYCRRSGSFQTGTGRREHKTECGQRKNPVPFSSQTERRISGDRWKLSVWGFLPENGKWLGKSR